LVVGDQADRQALLQQAASDCSLKPSSFLHPRSRL
jgi:hypothetical protein